MTEIRVPRPRFALFVIADVALLALAGLIVFLSEWPLGSWQIVAAAVCTMAAAWVGVLPAVLEYRAEVRLTETAQLADAATRLGHLEQIQRDISAATGQWQTAHDLSIKTTTAAKEIADRMTAESKDFMAFIEKANDREKAHMRLEVEKLRRTEGDWLQTAVHLLDHVYGVQRAASASGQPRIVAQLAQFQNACRDIVRRMGLVPVIPELGEPFDAERHAAQEGIELPDDAIVTEVLATGFAYQGQLVRKPLVAAALKPVAASAAPADEPQREQPQLTL